MFCVHCGEKVNGDGKFCTGCGSERVQPVFKSVYAGEMNSYAAGIEEQPAKSVPDQVKGTLLQATERINAMVGEQGTIEVNLKDVFSSVFKKHEKEEGELLFIAGTSLTTPNESEISASWPKPWLFSRIFLMLVFAYILLYVCVFEFQNSNAIPGLILVGSFAVPFSLLIFFWEMNAPRNISIYETAKMFFIGGTASLVLTLILYSIFPVYHSIYGLDYTGATVVGIVEEVGKLAVIIYFIKKLNPKFILNGLLIGATVGAGFAAFESAGYVFNALGYETDAMLSTIFLRAWTAIGTHIVWSAIAGAALVYVKGDHALITDHVLNVNFLKLFVISVILHAVWDMPIHTGEYFYLLSFVLIGVAWLFIFTFINAGLKQIGRLNVNE
ncbi:Membrane proteinase PrsW, cleaves anti-sigma factor RsiW, M82 family [Planococcus glaciei]|uniref:PrsW family glutamic-type intramembrane protease n=1 Tax=Planococcus glaciei TaxID=459472 RepID=UPI0008906DF6|nr:PrsW family intramembrane metalloprotease [Planococcus glaciei]SDI64538.1 Membrane proteinase PrsW, cleaves anti-sigma factor RsiW, M82 family [Planococcus glaciei]